LAAQRERARARSNFKMAVIWLTDHFFNNLPNQNAFLLTTILLNTNSSNINTKKFGGKNVKNVVWISENIVLISENFVLICVKTSHTSQLAWHDSRVKFIFIAKKKFK
jgi:hypothetical protein